MDRRRFLGSILVAGMAPAIVRADALMRVFPSDDRWSHVSVTHAHIVHSDDLTERTWRDGRRAYYTYSTSFVVAVAVRPGERIRRVWADNLVIVPPEPVKTRRGYLYRFDDLDITPFGNRIPTISFESAA